MTEPETVVVSTDEYRELLRFKQRYEELQTELDSLRDVVATLRRMIFGQSSEQTKYVFTKAHSAPENPNQMLLEFGDSASSVAQQDTAGSTPGDDSKEIDVQSHKRRCSTRINKTLKQAIEENEPLETIEYEIPADQRICPCCGKELQRIGACQRWELIAIPAKIGVRKHVRYTYACEHCKKSNEPVTIVKAPAKPSLLPRTYASAELVAYVGVQKYDMGCPVYRLVRSFKAAGYPLTRQTLNSHLVAVDPLYLSPMVKALHEHLTKRDLLFADETPLRVLRDKDGHPDHSNSYIWLVRTGNDGLPPIVTYTYSPDRRANNICELLKGFSGYLHTDGYQGYHNLPASIKNVGCWLHVRRKFEHACRQIGDQQQPTIASQGLNLCNELCKIEREIKGLPPDQLLNERRRRAKPILAKLQDLVENSGYIAHEATRKAIKYLRDQWKYLQGYLADGRLEISNNRSERSIKAFVIDRKNFLFSNTPGGAKASANWMTLIATARENGLDPYKYLVWLLNNASELATTDENWPEKLLPWNAPEECKAKDVM